jgi:transaldolase/glucose-6-phosphate isomerase
MTQPPAARHSGEAFAPAQANPLRRLSQAGQAVWLDYLHRRILHDGGLETLITRDGLTGLTSNPAIFEQAIAAGDAYDAALKALLETGDRGPMALYEALAIDDIQGAADLLRPTFDRLGGADGFVSLEVSPYLAHDTEGTIAEARRLWRAVDRPNLMIKVPGTPAGARAIETLIGEGINVNVTLLFSVAAYGAVAEAHLRGLEARRARGGDLARVHGVASVFVSRVDGAIDPLIDARLKEASPEEAKALAMLRGKIAIANAKAAYAHYLTLIETPRWRALAGAGARPQRLLWASTGTKDPTYSDVLYVEALIGPDTVDTMPPKTMDAFRDHGAVAPTLRADLAEAETILAQAADLGLDLDRVTTALTAQGVSAFSAAFDSLLSAVAAKRERILDGRMNAQVFALPPDLSTSVDATLARAATAGWSRRLWAGDAELWTGGGEADWVGWLGAGLGQAVDLTALEALAQWAKASGADHAILLGMGGSSLGPFVLAETLSAAAGFPSLLVLDSTDPDEIRRVEAAIDVRRAIFIVSSKSGTTLEVDLLRRYFFERVQDALGSDRAAARFVAITDPGTPLESLARAQGYAFVLAGEPRIGGRFSVLSNFGLAPAALMGLDVRGALSDAALQVHACSAGSPAGANPGLRLGVVLGEAALAGRDKLTLLMSARVGALGAWLEQLIAESTGKNGQGVIPVDDEPPGSVDAYGADRVFARVRLASEPKDALDALAEALAKAGHPVVTITLNGPETLFQEFFRWEIATATLGAVLGINPFDQPDVESAKVRARQIISGEAPTDGAGLALLREGPLTLYAQTARPAASFIEALRLHLAQGAVGDFYGLLAFIDRKPANERALRDLRRQLFEATTLATVVGFGPRFLHSTGQAFKGGPNRGVFLQITSRRLADLEVPSLSARFGEIQTAQAAGDLAVMVERGRRILRLDLGEDAGQGLAALAALWPQVVDGIRLPGLGQA